MKQQSIQSSLVAKCVRFDHLFQANRIEEMVEYFYAEDAVMEGLDFVAQRGRSAIVSVFEDARAVYRSITINLDPVQVVGTVAFGGITNVNLLPNNGQEIHRGVMIWRKIGDDWFVQSDFFFPQPEPFVVSVAG